MSDARASYYVAVIDRDTEEVVHRIGEHMTLRRAERVEDGANINLHHAKFYTEVRREDQDEA